MNGSRIATNAQSLTSSASSSFEASTNSASLLDSSTNLSSAAGNTELSTCRYCKGISLKSLSEPGGYRHASNRASLVRSAQKCKFCSLLFRKDRTKKQNTPLYLALDTLDVDENNQLCLKVFHGEDGEESDIVFFLFTIPGV
jgi:hypothetical protein